MEVESMKLLAAALCMSVGVITPAIAEGMIAGKAMEAMGRNPEAGNAMFPRMIVGLAIVESLAIYCLVIALIILFAA
jgi:F-type H+-transporting ATPase subunit c